MDWKYDSILSSNPKLLSLNLLYVFLEVSFSYQEFDAGKVNKSKIIEFLGCFHLIVGKLKCTSWIVEGVDCRKTKIY